MIASVTGSTTQYQWNKFASQQSALINLTAGHKYYIEILHKEGTGSDHWAVAWQGPGITQQVIGSAYLTPWRGPMTGDITGNGFVSSDDLVLFVESWLNTDCTMSPELDLNGDCVIDYQDFTVFAGNWRNDLPQAWWPMNETSGTTVSEVMFGHTGTLQNSPGTWTTGKVGNCLLLDGIDDYVLVSGYKGITGTASRTCAAWIKTNTVSGQVLTWGDYAAGQKWVIRVNENGTLRAEVHSGYIYGTTSLTDNQWHHIAVVLANDGSLDISEARLYVDGQLETTGGVLAYPINTGGIQDVQLGVFTPLPVYFNGLMDDVRIYSRALTDAEITALAQ